MKDCLYHVGVGSLVFVVALASMKILEGNISVVGIIYALVINAFVVYGMSGKDNVVK